MWREKVVGLWGRLRWLAESLGWLAACLGLLAGGYSSPEASAWLQSTRPTPDQPGPDGDGHRPHAYRHPRRGGRRR
jgi:hypothetical protein